jgi:hypothetical protein
MAEFDGLNAALQANAAAVFAQPQQEIVETTIVDIGNKGNEPPPTPDPTPDSNTSSLTNQPPPADTPVVETPKEETPAATPAKSFNELLAERYEGKYKTEEELTQALAPKELEFASEQIKMLNELSKSGVKIDNEFLRFTSIDFHAMEDPAQVYAESRRLESPGITDKEIAFEYKTTYRTDEWSADGEDPNEIEEVMSAKMVREITARRDALIERQEKMSIAPKSDPAKAEAQAKLDLAAKAQWEKTSDTIASELSKLSYKISDTTDKALNHDFDFDVTAKDNAEVVNLFKKMGDSTDAFLDEFKGADGKVDLKKVYEGLTKMKNFDKAVKASYTAGLTKGSMKEMAGIKNIQFNSDGTQRTVEAPSNAEVLKASMKKEWGM